MIPKVIHYCWFGRNPLPPLAIKCIESWKNYLSDDYTVCLWNEHSFDYNEYDFTREAYNAKKWAFVVDYVRLWCIYNFGGVYFDTDVELLKPIDELPNNFFAIEKDYEPIALGLGFGAEKGNEVIRDMLSEYYDKTYKNNNMYQITSPKLSSNYFNRMGYIVNDNEVHNFLGFTIYPSEYFCPKSNIKNTITITNNIVVTILSLLII